MPKLFIPKEAIDELLILVNASTKQLQALTKLFNSEESTSPHSRTFLSSIADILAIPIDDAYDVMRLIIFVSQQKEALESSNDQLISDIITFLQKNGREDSIKALSAPPQQEALLNLFGPKPIAELAEKKNKLETGLLKTLTDIEGTCDLRPVFNLERSHIVDKVITTIARLTLKDDKDKEECIVFQLNADSLKKLQEFSDITSKKIQIMETEITAVSPDKNE